MFNFLCQSLPTPFLYLDKLDQQSLSLSLGKTFTDKKRRRRSGRVGRGAREWEDEVCCPLRGLNVVVVVVLYSVHDSSCKITTSNWFRSDVGVPAASSGMSALRTPPYPCTPATARGFWSPAGMV